MYNASSYSLGKVQYYAYCHHAFNEIICDLQLPVSAHSGPPLHILLYANTSFQEVQNNLQKYEFQKGAFQILASISSAELELLEWQ